MSLPGELSIDAEVDLNLANGGYFLRARLNIRLLGIDCAVAQSLVNKAEQTCPFSKAMRGNIDVAIKVV